MRAHLQVEHVTQQLFTPPGAFFGKRDNLDALVSQPLVESAIQTEQEIHYVDRYPPPVPEELVAVAETGRARLVWQRSEAPDLAGYIVYRKAAGGGWERLTPKPIVATTYVDTSVAAGRAYDFRVTAIDQSGNESAPGAEVHVAVP